MRHAGKMTGSASLGLSPENFFRQIMGKGGFGQGPAFATPRQDIRGNFQDKLNKRLGQERVDDIRNL